MDFENKQQMSAKQGIYAAPTVTPAQYECMCTAAQIANKVLKAVIAECTPGKPVHALCCGSDEMMRKELALVYTNTPDMEKNIAFPTCVSINNCVGNYSPVSDEGLALSIGDVVKIELAVDIDGFVQAAGHTMVVNPEMTQPLVGKAADVIVASHYAAQAAFNMIKPGAMSGTITDAVEKIAKAFGVTAVKGVVTSNTKRHVIDGERIVLNKLQHYTGVQNFEFQMNEIFIVDIAMSTGTGEAKEMDVPSSVFRRNVNKQYNLKLRAARNLFSEVDQNSPVMPFTMRDYTSNKAKIGLTEIVKNELFLAYPVTFEKKGEMVARFKFTMALLPNGSVKLAGSDIPLPFVESDKQISNESLQKLIQNNTLASDRVSKALA